MNDRSPRGGSNWAQDSAHTIGDTLAHGGAYGSNVLEDQIEGRIGNATRPIVSASKWILLAGLAGLIWMGTRD